MWSRRDVLRGLGIGAAGVTAQLAMGRALGETPPDPDLDAAQRSTNRVLQIFCPGGMSHRHSVWVTDAQASQNHPFWYNGTLNLTQRAFRQSVGADVVGLGPEADAEWAEVPGFAGRTRLVTLGHGVPEHSQASAMAWTGLGSGAAFRGASLGAAFNQAYGSATRPVAWVIRASASPMALATGVLDPWTRPVGVGPGDSLFATNLTAQATGDNTLLDAFADRYETRLDSAATTSAAWQAWLSARAFGATTAPTLDPTPFSGWPTSRRWPTRTGATWTAGTNTAIGKALDLAVWLFLKAGARYVGIVDESLNPTAYGQDSHGRTDTQLWQIHDLGLALLLHELGRVEAALDLSQTLVMLSSEFGRDTSSGDRSSHGPGGYAALLLGGPTVSTPVVGTMDEHLGGPTNSDPLRHQASRDKAGNAAFTPADLLAAAAWWGGIDAEGGSGANPVDMFRTEDLTDLGGASRAEALYTALLA